MKSYIDAFYEVLHKNSVKRRRMISLLLVLSLFVSSGVLWELRDIGITMVNEPICGVEEHTHTDECYEDVLVCGLEENEEHTHGPECYEKVLTCGMEEHIHTASCFTDEELPQYDPDDYDSNVVILDTTEEEEVEESFDTEEIPALQLGSEMRTALDDETGPYFDVADPGTIETIDNIARGIKFTLFDYHEPGNTLEAEQNNYDMSLQNYEGNNIYWHHNIKYDGVNEGRDSNKNILFFAYGTPPDHGAETGEFLKSQQDTPYTDANGVTVEKGNYIDTNGNKVNEENKVPCYYPGTPDMNNYAGDYKLDSYRSGNRPVQGIVEKELYNGYPRVALSDVGQNLEYLFGNTETAYKTVYENVNHLLKIKPIKNSEHLVYNSNENYAYFDKATHDFTIYNGTYRIINKDHHFAGDYNNLTEETYQTDNGYEMKIGFFPFDQYDISRRDPNFNGTAFNHHFGLKMEAEFQNTKTTKDPVIFKYSGDDDMWVFIDDVLVLDIGGIHEPAEGLIDFTNGYVWVQDDSNGQDYNQIMTTEGMNTELESHELPDNFGNNEHKWIVKPIDEFFAGTDKSCSANDGKNHTIKMFYLERGGCYSNLAMDMNLPTVKPLSVVKKVNYQGHYSDDYDNKEYEFVVLEKKGESFDIADLGVNTENPFSLKAGQRKDFYGLYANREFKVVEVNADKNIFSNVYINGAESSYVGESQDVSSEWNIYENVNNYNFTNEIRQELKNLTVNKSWAGQSPVSPNIYFKIYRTDSVVGSSDAPVTKPVEIGGTMTFVLNAGNNWQQTFSDLPVRYGAHIYSYSVEEINEPNGYEASYSKSETNNTVTLTITNRSRSNSYIHVKKQWLNAVGDEAKPVQLTLKRKKKLVSTHDATLQVNLYDPGGNLISSSAVTEVYAGGSAEFALDVPANVQYYRSESDNYNNNCYKTTPSTVNCQQLGDRLFRVSNLQTGTNVVDVRIYTDNADDELLLLHHSFTNSTNGWEPNGNGVEVVTSGNSSYAKGDALLIKNRTDSNHGAKLRLDPLKFKAGKTYTFTMGVYFDNRWIPETGELESNPYEATFVMTFNDGREKPNNESFKRISTTHNTNGSDGGGWVGFVGTITLPEDINPYGMYILVETEQGSVGPASFRIDEFLAIEGYKNISVEPGTGKISIALKPYYDDPFGYNDFNGWIEYGGTNLSLGEYNNDYYVLISNRNDVSNGMKKNVPLLVPGQKYRFQASVSGDDDSSSHIYLMSIDKRNPDPNPQGQYTQFKTIAALPAPITGYGWGTFDAVYTIPPEADQNNMFVYFETPYGSDDKKPFRVWKFKVTDADDFTQPKEGYTLENEIYTSNYSRYSVTVQEGSITTKDYEEDTSWAGETIYLGGNNPWTWSQVRTYFNEDNNYRYIYYIASETVNGATLNVDYILLPIENNNVSANDAETPILVKNQNIRFKLPATGGKGTVGIYFAGTVLITISLLSGYAVYRQKRRRK